MRITRTSHEDLNGSLEWLSKATYAPPVSACGSTKRAFNHARHEIRYPRHIAHSPICRVPPTTSANTATTIATTVLAAQSTVMKFAASTCIALVLAISAFTTTTSAAAATATAMEARVLQQGSNVAQDVLAAINTARAQNSLPALCLNTKLTAASQQQANSMAAGGYISPVGQDGSMPTARAQALGFDTQAVFEVVGARYKNASVAVSEWLKLADRDQYLLGDFKFLGAAKTVNNKQQYRSFWVVDLSQDDGEEECA